MKSQPNRLALLMTLALTASPLLAQTKSQPTEDDGSNDVEAVLGEIRGDKVPAGDNGRFYLPGSAAARDNINPGSYSKQFRLDAHLRAGLTNRCGSLNFFHNIEAEARRLQHKISETLHKAQATIMASISGAVSSLFQYMLMKINPTLGELATKQLDEDIELFNLKVKQCEDYEREVRQGKNPFDEIAEIAVGEQWKQTIGMVNAKETTLVEAEKHLFERARKNGVPMADGKNYGGEGQEPINITKSLLKAGMNLTLSRGDKEQWDNDFSGDVKNNPILGDFKNAKELYNFIEEIYGANEITIGESGAQPTNVNAIAGRGYERKYTKYRNEYIKDLRDYVYYRINRPTFEEKTGQIIPPAELDDIRKMPEYPMEMEIEARAQQYAINRLRRNLYFAKQALKTGVYAPDLQQSGMKGPSEIEYRSLYYRILDDIREIGQRAWQY